MKYLIGDRVEVWHLGEIRHGTIKSVRKTIFGNVKYTVAVKQFAGFDPDGIGREKYRYCEYSADEILSTTNQLTKEG